jgi:hypothetical protein
MDNYTKGLDILTENFGNNKDNILALATISLEAGTDDKPRPNVRDVDAYYEDGVFYAVTYAKSNKILEIASNERVAITAKNEVEIEKNAPPKTAWLSANAVGENLGWVLDPKNAEIREKLRSAFSAWYDFANNENDENCCFLAVRLTKGVINLNHHETLIHMDFSEKSATVKGKEI